MKPKGGRSAKRASRKETENRQREGGRKDTESKMHVVDFFLKIKEKANFHQVRSEKMRKRAPQGDKKKEKKARFVHREKHIHTHT
jgi:hypothetical protein